MDIRAIGAAGGFQGITGGAPRGTPDGGFGAVLASLMENVESSGAAADDAVAGLALGENVDLHSVILATEMESLSVQLAVQVRNRVVETVQNVLNMQV